MERTLWIAEYEMVIILIIIKGDYEVFQKLLSLVQAS